MDPANIVKLSVFAQSDDREWTPLFAERDDEISNVEAARRRGAIGEFPGHSQ
ncbi:MAG: hypothetical protein OXI87_00255 [Albidovulum sp.]|nr:hypothetical protein [Albidovulum sp.]